MQNLIKISHTVRELCLVSLTGHGQVGTITQKATEPELSFLRVTHFLAGKTNLVAQRFHWSFFLSFLLPVRLNLCAGHQTESGIQVQSGGWGGGGEV